MFKRYYLFDHYFVRSYPFMIVIFYPSSVATASSAGCSSLEELLDELEDSSWKTENSGVRAAGIASGE